MPPAAATAGEMCASIVQQFPRRTPSLFVDRPSQDDVLSTKNELSYPRSAAAVASSAGKNDSIASSDTTMSTGVPNTVVVLKNDSTP